MQLPHTPFLCCFSDQREEVLFHEAKQAEWDIERKAMVSPLPSDPSRWRERISHHPLLVTTRWCDGIIMALSLRPPGKHRVTMREGSKWCLPPLPSTIRADRSKKTSKYFTCFPSLLIESHRESSTDSNGPQPYSDFRIRGPDVTRQI